MMDNSKFGSDVKPNQSKENLSTTAAYEKYFGESIGNNFQKLENFPKYVNRETITRFLVRNEIFKMQLKVHGSILDCGVHRGASLMTWSQLSSIYEPANYTREVIGFDTFTGFPEIDPQKDIHKVKSYDIKEGDLSVGSAMKQDIEKAISIWDKTRYLNHILKTRLVQGDIINTLPQFLEENKHLVVSLLHLDVDIYKPTKTILELIVPRMPKGAVILFDELNSKVFPGETQAVIDTIGINALEIKRFDFCPNISYAIL